MMKKLLIMMFITASLYGGAVVAQIPVEVFAGHEKASLDLMFFRFFDQPKRDYSKNCVKWKKWY